MTSSSFWPMTVAISILISASLSVELWARFSAPSVERIVIQSSQSAVDEATSDSRTDPFGSVLGTTHQEARELARRGDLEGALAKFGALVTENPGHALLVAEQAHVALRTPLAESACAQLIARRSALSGSPVILLDSARCEALMGHDTDAIAGLRAAVDTHPHHSGLRLELGKMLRDRGESAEAVRVLEPATAGGSNDERARALASLGHCHVALGQLEPARTVFEEAVQRAPAAVNVWMNVARGLMQSSERADRLLAVQYALRATQLAPELPEVYSLLGRVHESAGKELEAREAYRQAVRLDGKYTFARRRLVRLFLEAEDYRLARQHAEQLLSSEPESAEHHFLAGLVEFRSGTLDLAREHYQRAIEKAVGRYPEAHYNLGLLERQAKRPAEAIAAYERALEQRPDFRAAYNNLGLVYVDLREFDRARAAFQRAIEMSPGYGAAWINLARCHSEEQKWPEAVEAYRTALAHSPSNRNLTVDLAIALRKTGRPREAVQLYDRLLESNPRYVSGWYNLGIALEAAGDDAKARAAYERALGIDPEHLRSLKKLAQLEAKAGLRAAARTHFTEALDRDPGDQGLRIELAQLLLAENDLAACSHAAQLALAQAPEDSAAKALLVRCDSAH